MIEIRTEIAVNAPPERVWRVLTDFPGHPDWNPFIRALSGDPRPGQRLTVSIKPPQGKGMTFRPKVLAAVPRKELRWIGRFLIPGIFDGEHFFVLEPTNGGGTRFIHGERFSGVLVPLAKSALEGDTRAGFIRMNEAIKMRAESADRNAG